MLGSRMGGGAPQTVPHGAAPCGEKHQFWAMSLNKVPVLLAMKGGDTESPVCVQRVSLTLYIAARLLYKDRVTNWSISSETYMHLEQGSCA